MTTTPLRKLDIVLTIFNQEKLIERVLYGIFANTTTPFDLNIVFDGCTDRTKPRALRYISRHRPRHLGEVRTADAPNVFETRANNIGFKMATSDYIVTLQDDMVIQEKGWERRLTFPLRIRDDIFAVGGRIAQDIDLMDAQHHTYMNRKGAEFGNLDRQTCAIRDVINRGPIAFRASSLKKLGYLNESYAPSDLDDADICLRAWRDFGWTCGAFSIRYLSRLEWGKARAKDSTMQVSANISRNQVRLGKDHQAYIASHVKHNEDIHISEGEIDHVGGDVRRISRPFWYPIRFGFEDVRVWVNKLYWKMHPKHALNRIISKKKAPLISLLRRLNTMPGFKRVFYWVYEIRRERFEPSRFVACMTDEGFLLGTYDFQKHAAWKRMAADSFEPAETSLIKKVLPLVDRFVDIDAHIGYYSCLVASRSKVPVYAFEPNPENFRSLSTNIEINRARHVQAFNVGLGERREDAAIIYGSDAMSSIVPKTFGKPPQQQTRIQVDTLDSYADTMPEGTAMFIKMDTEGSELPILKGGTAFLRKHRPAFLLIEIVKHWGGGENTGFTETFKLLDGLGYDAYIVTAGPKLITPVGDAANLDSANYFFVRKDMVASL